MPSNQDYGRSGIREIDFDDGYGGSTIFYRDGGRLSMRTIGELRKMNWSTPERREFAERQKGIEQKVQGKNSEERECRE